MQALLLPTQFVRYTGSLYFLYTDNSSVNQKPGLAPQLHKLASQSVEPLRFKTESSSARRLATTGFCFKKLNKPLSVQELYSLGKSKNETMMKKILFATVLTAATALAGTAQMSADQPERIGNMKTEKFQKKNAKGGEKVASIKPSNGTATETDKQLMMQVAAGGMKQLMVSQAVVAKATNPKVKMLAQSEVEEQTGVSNKLKELAAAKGITLPSAPDAETQRLVAQAQSLSGTQLDQFYLSESGVKGHQQLEATMNTVSSTAGLKELRQLAGATLPVIKMHLEVSQAEMNMTNGGTAQR